MALYSGDHAPPAHRSALFHEPVGVRGCDAYVPLAETKAAFEALEQWIR
jgi:hypothetical protein